MVQKLNRNSQQREMIKKEMDVCIASAVFQTTQGNFRPVARLFCGGGQIGQILGPFMITGRLSCDRVEFGHFGGGSDDPPDPPLATGLNFYEA